HAVVSVAIAPARLRRGETLVLAARASAARSPKVLAARLHGAVPACAAVQGPAFGAPPKGAKVTCTQGGRAVSPAESRSLATARAQRRADAGDSGSSGNTGNSGAPPS